MKFNKKTVHSSEAKHIDTAHGISEYRLNNSLKILLQENHSAPVVSFMIVYRVGSRNEAVGHTGATHFLEHMMFKGTSKFNPEKGTGVKDILKKAGALLNATTSYDRTNYFECLPAEYLKLCVEVEADRMRNLLLKQTDRDSEMTVVRNEFERHENNPGTALQKAVFATAFRESPYHHPVIGWLSDVENVPLERFREFYNTFYWPNNATVIVVGDFQTNDALSLINKYFGKIPSSPDKLPQVYTLEPPQEGERFVEVRRAGDLPQVMLAYHTPKASHKDIYALTAFASILGDSDKRSSRLYKALMETGLVTGCWSNCLQMRDPGLFLLGATIAPGKNFAEVESHIYAEIDKLAKEPPTEDELNRVKKANRKGTVLTAADPQNFTNLLCIGEAIVDWKWLIEYDDCFDRVSVDDIKRVARIYFDDTNRTRGHFIPSVSKVTHTLNTTNSDSAINKTTKKKTSSSASKSTKNAASTSAKVTHPSLNLTTNFASKVVKEILPNELTVLAMHNPGTGSIAINGTLFAGSCFSLPDQALLPSIVASMLSRGSAHYTKTKLAETLEEMGIRFGFDAQRWRVSFSSLVVKSDIEKFFAVLADLLRNPLFAEGELALVGYEYNASLTRAINQTASQAANAFARKLYPPGHPCFQRKFEELIDELKIISPDALKNFHSNYYSPGSTIISVVGDIEPDLAIKLISQNFGDWRGTSRKSLPTPKAISLSDAQEIRVNLEDKPNVDIIIGHPSDLTRLGADFFAAQIANAALGRDALSSRLGKCVRIKHGLTYHIASYFEDSSYGANPAWKTVLSVNPGNVSKALQLAKVVLSDYLKQGISKEELDNETSCNAGSFITGLRSSDGIASYLTIFEALGLTMEDLDRFPKEYLSLTQKQVNTALRKYLHPESAITVIAGTTSQMQ